MLYDLRDHGTKALLLDDITRLRMHRADDQDVLDLIRAFMSMHVTLVLIGVDIPGSGLLREGRHDPGTGQWLFPPSRHAGIHGLEATQTERRFDLVELDRFRYDTPAQVIAWTRHLAGIEQQLRLMDAAPGMLTDGTMPEYLYRRTHGVVGLLERLIEDGCREAIDTGAEFLTQAVLDNVALSLPDIRGRDARAGEIPPIQLQHGGAWQKAWRLPVVFACPAHRRLLEYLCPSCRQPPMSAAPGSPAWLIRRAFDGGLHPAQCRAALKPRAAGRHARPCGARLDAPARTGEDPPVPDDLLALQDRLLQLLSPEGPAAHDERRPAGHARPVLRRPPACLQPDQRGLAAQPEPDRRPPHGPEARPVHRQHGRYCPAAARTLRRPAAGRAPGRCPHHRRRPHPRRQ
jgi:hypothetical protein